MCLLVGPNGSGKTQLLDLVFSLLYAGWKSSHSIRKISGKQAFIEVLRDVFLLRSRKDKPIINSLKNWNGKSLHVAGNIVTKSKAIISVKIDEALSTGSIDFRVENGFETPPITYFSVLPLEYYRGIVALNSMSPKWRVVPFSKSEFIIRLFTTYDSKHNVMPGKLKESFKDKFGISKIYIDNVQIKLESSGNVFSIEHAASGLKGLAAIYLAIKHGLIDHNTELVIIDEPEVSLHPSWTYKFVEWMVEVMKHFKFRLLMATHSPLIIDSFNVAMKKNKLRKITVGTAIRNLTYGFDWTFKDFDSESLAEVSHLLDDYFEIINSLYGE